jgi:hypothetical protein
MADPTKTHEYAWDEHLLEQAMETARKIQKKRKEPLLPEGPDSSLLFWASGPYAFLGVRYICLPSLFSCWILIKKHVPVLWLVYLSLFALLQIAHMDNLHFPPHSHIFDWSIPRVCAVKSSDFAFVVKNDVDRKMLNNTTMFGFRDVCHFSTTYHAAMLFSYVNPL